MANINEDNASHASRSGAADSQDAVGLVEDLLAKASQSGASDVHFEPMQRGLVVKFRLDGVLTALRTLPPRLGARAVTRLKVLAGLLTYRNDIPQEGRIQQPIAPDARVIDQRLAVFPTIHGQRAVVRLFYEEPSLTELDRLGLDEGILSALRRIAAGSQGVVLLTGPAGSGKSTTLGAVLRWVLGESPGKSIVTLEDPVERRIDGVTQVQISPHGEMTFPTALRSLLRQDPEVLMIGEIRDAETARIVIEAGLTGHLLLSTMHSGSPAGALLRLLEMGAEPYQVTSSVQAVVNQRLVRRLCEHCRRPVGAEGPAGAGGCEACFGTGFRGRALIAEMVELDGALRKALLAKADLDELEQVLAARGHCTLRQDGRRLVREGITTRGELDRVCAGMQ